MQCAICHKKAEFDTQQWFIRFGLCEKHKMYTLRKPQFYEVKQYYINKKKLLKWDTEKEAGDGEDLENQ